MWTIFAATCGAIAGGFIMWRMAKLEIERIEFALREELITAKADIARLRQPRDVRGRFLPRISPELDAMLAEADEAAQLDSAP